jgi:hypothetical protein
MATAMSQQNLNQRKRWYRTTESCFLLGVSRGHLLNLRRQGILREGEHYRVLAVNRIDYDIEAVEEALRRRRPCLKA